MKEAAEGLTSADRKDIAESCGPVGLSEQETLKSYRKLYDRKLTVERECTATRKDLELLRQLYSGVLDLLRKREEVIRNTIPLFLNLQRLVSQLVISQKRQAAALWSQRDAVLEKAAQKLKADSSEGGSPAETIRWESGIKLCLYRSAARFIGFAAVRYEAELIRQSPLFDARWYVAHYPDVRGMDPAMHYNDRGWRQDYDPSPRFSSSAYRILNPDVSGNPLLHYLMYGRAEGRQIMERRIREAEFCLTEAGLFDPEWYRRENPEIGSLTPWFDYILHGWKKNLDPSPEFSTEIYYAENPDARGVNPLLHYLFSGTGKRRSYEKPERILSRSLLFDGEWYLKTYPDVAESELDPASHYLQIGFLKGYDPSVFFGTETYYVLNPDIRGINPLLHYLQFGCHEGRQFVAGVPVLEPADYILAEPTGLFNAKWYLKNNPDLAGVKISPIEHFMNHGWKEGREPSDQFSIRDYCNFNPDLKAATVQPMTHFIFSGISEGRKYAAQITEMDECQTRRQLNVVPKLYDPDRNESLPFNGERTIAVHLHLYYTDMAEYFVRHLKLIPRKFDLYVSLPLSGKTDYYQHYFEQKLPNVNQVEVIQTPNRGRDIAPFIVTFGKKLMTYDWICHVHSKRSPHASRQLAGWLDYIMDHLFGSAEQLNYIFSLLEQNDRIVFPPAYSQLDHDDSGWGRNYHFIQEYISQHPVLNLKSLPRFIEFSHGSMLWARGAAMAGYLDLPLTYDDFPEEPISSDATLAHVLERLSLLKTAFCGAPADMLFLKRDADDMIQYQILHEKQERFDNLFAGAAANPKKLVFVSHDSDKSGGPILALNIARTLKEMGYKLYIIILKQGCLLPEFEACGTVQLVPQAEFNKFQASLPILHDAGFKNVLLNTVVSGSFAPVFRDAGFHVITLIHEMGFSIRKYQWNLFCNQVFAGSEKVVMPSSVVARSWKEIGLEVPAEKLIINPQGDYWSRQPTACRDREAAHREICRELQIPENSKIVIAAAIPERRKGIDAFVETAEDFLKTDPDVRFVWIGFTPEKKTEFSRLMKKTEALKNCIFTGFKKDLDKYMAGAQIFFLPSLADPFPAVTLLAASQGTPSVLCDGCTGSADFCRNFAAGLVREYSAKNFAAEIRRLLHDPELYARVSRETLTFSREFHSMRQYVIDLMSYFPDGLKKVSCIVPNYQYEKYLPERLNSIIKQDYPIYDIVFLDDGSKDNSLKVGEEILSKQNIDYVILPNKTNSGSVFRQWFKGIQAAKGDFVWIAEADDSCSSEFLRKTVAGFDDPEVYLSYAQSCLMDSRGKVFNDNYKTHTDSISAVKWSQNYVAPMSFEINDGLAVKNTIPNASAIVIRKSAAEKINKDFLFRFKVAGDWVFYLELLKGGRVAFTPEVLNYYRRHNASVVNRNLLRDYQEIEMIHHYILEHFEVNNATVLAMEKEFRQGCTGIGPAFKPSLDYRKYLKPKKATPMLLFLTDDLENNTLCQGKVLENFARNWEVRLGYTGKNTPKPELLEKLSPRISFFRLQDFLGATKPDVKSLIFVAEFSGETLKNELSRLKLYLSAGDILLILDRDSCFVSSPDIVYEQGSLTGKLEAILRTPVEKIKKRILYFPASAEKAGSKNKPEESFCRG